MPQLFIWIVKGKCVESATKPKGDNVSEAFNNMDEARASLAGNQTEANFDAVDDDMDEPCEEVNLSDGVPVGGDDDIEVKGDDEMDIEDSTVPQEPDEIDYTYTEAELKKLNKKQLTEIAESDFNIDVAHYTKAQIIGDILIEQK